MGVNRGADADNHISPQRERGNKRQPQFVPSLALRASIANAPDRAQQPDATAMLKKELIDHFLISPGEKVRLKDHETGWAQTKELKELGKDVVKERAKEILDASLAELAEAQELLYADDRYAVLVVLQALDAAGKDGTIKHVMSGVNPQGCQVFSFKQPSAEELDHNFLWRYMKSLPERGRIGIFNRSYYEDVLVVKVHPELLDRQKLPSGKRGKSFWSARFDDINAFERHLARNGTVIVKFFLHVSKDEQKQRFLERLENPEKHWKFSEADLVERGFWDDYIRAYEEALTATSTEEAPWYVVPADQKWITRAIVADVLVSAIRGLDLRYPELTDERREALAGARERLLAEQGKGTAADRRIAGRPPAR
jgi:PPK2 family polyphosphate:nucleotide phosphotransferase